MGLSMQFNTQQLELSLRNTCDRASKSAAREVHNYAIKIRDLAKKYAPKQDGDLINAIDIKVTKDPLTRRNIYTVFVDPSYLKMSGKPVGDYAMLVERNMSPHGTGSLNGRSFKASAKSLAKGGGGRYLTRASKELLTAVQAGVAVAVRRSLTSGAGIVPRANNSRIMREEDYGDGQ